MSEFTEIPIVSPLPDGKHWALRKAFTYYVGEENSTEAVVAPTGFITDFASVPRVFWQILPKCGKYGNAAIIHDYLYWVQDYSRKRSDEIFLEAMLVLGVPKHTAKAMYWAVRIGAKKSWKRLAKTPSKDKFVSLTGKYEEIEKIEI